MKTVQYTIRGIPKEVDAMIRKQAKRQGKSFNKTVVDIIQLQVTGSSQPTEATIFERMHGANTLDMAFFEAIDAQAQVDPKLWN